ncbi:MAG TPA: polyprenyl synthetase family protein [Polyangiales bacterium]|nr:polyprenyl synthetase family protein [Polyangiales bacterium]
MIPAAPFEVLQHAAHAHASAANANQYLLEIQGLLAESLPELERVLARVAGAGPEPLPASAGQLVLAGGKRVRPVATLLTTLACGGDAARAIPLAASVELIHSATLLHDDVIDEGEERRGRPASRVLWGNLVSVLSGDLLLTSALELVHAAGVPGAMTDTLATMQRLIGGEVAQLKARGRLDLGTEGYLEIVRGKTASLFANACRAGARVAGAPEATIDAVGRFGERVGIAFQIVDDVLDLEGIPHEVGKRLGHDLAEGKTTLPLALALQSDAAALRPLLITARAGDTLAAARVSQAPSVRRACGQAREFALRETELGMTELDVLPPSAARELLAQLVRGLIQRRA